MISLDTTLVTDDGSDARKRHAVYADRVDHLSVIVYTPPGMGEPLRLTSNLTIVPSNSRGRALFPLDAVRLGRKAAAHEPVDMITTQDPFITGYAGVRLSKRLGAPLLVQNHSDFFDNIHWIREHPLRNRVFNRLGKWVIQRADRLRVVNDAEGNKYLAMGIPAERICKVPTITDPAYFAQPVPPEQVAFIRESWGVRDHQRVVLWVGRPVWFKRLPVLLDAMRIVVQAEPEARLVLIGNMAQATEDLPAEIKARNLHNHVIMPGCVPFDDLPAVYRAGDVYVHASIYEGLGRVMVEAGAAGLPVVAFESAGVTEVVVDGENGYSLPQNDVAGFAARLLELVRDVDSSRQMGKRGRELALERFTAELLYERLMACWQATVEGNNRKGA
jgi:glycosyltransferase involved in cell wall biosynthesis